MERMLNDALFRTANGLLRLSLANPNSTPLSTPMRVRAADLRDVKFKWCFVCTNDLFWFRSSERYSELRLGGCSSQSRLNVRRHAVRSCRKAARFQIPSLKFEFEISFLQAFRMSVGRRLYAIVFVARKPSTDSVSFCLLRLAILGPALSFARIEAIICGLEAKS